MSTTSAKFLLFAALLLLVFMPNSAASEEEGVKCCKGSMIQKWIKISDQISKRFEELSLRFAPLAVCMKYVFRPLGKLWNYLLGTLKPAAVRCLPARFVRELTHHTSANCGQTGNGRDGAEGGKGFADQARCSL